MAAANGANPRSLGKESSNFCAGFEQRPGAGGFFIEEADKEPGKGEGCVPTRTRHATIPHQQRKFPHANKKWKFLRKFRKTKTAYYCECKSMLLRKTYYPECNMRMHFSRYGVCECTYPSLTECLNLAINTKNSEHLGSKAELHDDAPTRAAWVVITTQHLRKCFPNLKFGKHSMKGRSKETQKSSNNK